MKIAGITTGIEFENYISDLLRNYGFIVYDTPASNDYGADLILEYENYKISIQCKYYSKPVGVKAVQEVMGSLSYYKCDYGMVITNEVFTNQAENLAALNGILLIDGDELKSFRASEIMFRRTMDNFLEKAGNNETIQKPETEWYMSDLNIRYGVSNSRILQDFMSMGLPYYKVGREYRFNPDDVIKWEIQTKRIPYGRGEEYILPGYLDYKEDLSDRLEQAKKANNKEEVGSIKNEMHEYDIKPWEIGQDLLFRVAIIAIICLFAIFLVPIIIDAIR